MIGSVLLDGEPVVHLDDSGQWVPADPLDLEAEAVAKSLQATHDPLADYQIGDHHLPLGRGVLARAAHSLGGTAKFESNVPPLPEGAVA